MAQSVFLDFTGGDTFTGQLIGPAADNTAAPPYSFLGDLTTGYASSAAGKLDLMLSGSKGLELTSTTAVFLAGIAGTFTKNALGTTSTDGLILQNTTPAVIGTTVQISPRIKLSGTAYNSVSTLSETDYWVIENLPATVAGTTTSMLKFGSSIAGGAVSYPATLTSAGLFTANGFNSSNGQITSGHFTLQIGTDFKSGGSDGTLNFTNNGNTAGIGFDVTTDSLLKVRVRAQNAYGGVDALNYLQGGVLLTSATAPSVASGFGSGAAVAHSNGTAAFTVGVGTTTGNTGVITMPSAPNGWAAQCSNISSQTTNVAYTKQTATSQTSITIGNFSDIAGAHAWADNDVISIVAFPY